MSAFIKTQSSQSFVRITLRSLRKSLRLTNLQILTVIRGKLFDIEVYTKITIFLVKELNGMKIV